MDRAAKVITIGGAFAGVLAVATATVFMIRRVQKRGVRYTLFETGDKLAQERVLSSNAAAYLPSLGIFEENFAFSPVLLERVETAKDEVYSSAVKADFGECVASLTLLFEALSPKEKTVANITQTFKFRDDLSTAANSMGNQPQRAVIYLRRWYEWWQNGENFLPSSVMWLALQAVQVGITYFQNHPPGRQPRNDETWREPARLILRTAGMLTSGTAEEKIILLTEMSEYLQVEGANAA